MYPMSLDSTVGLARPQTKSLRATIPEGIVAYLGIQAGDKLDWTMENDKDGERIIIVRKSKVISPFEKQSKKRK
jgi:bifunctional DNA-binding transcriptional regulator/antitoxin component of YhaV-PrlF toxin-antitoxin module